MIKVGDVFIIKEEDRSFYKGLGVMGTVIRIPDNMSFKIRWANGEESMPFDENGKINPSHARYQPGNIMEFCDYLGSLSNKELLALRIKFSEQLE